jgi:beta-phosphoglucomutase family hydrolase
VTLRLAGRPIEAVLLDLDGVLTDTAGLHAEAWAETLDRLLAAIDPQGRIARFKRPRDYLDLIDGRPRRDGIRAFLADRGIELPEGAAAAPPGTASVAALAAAKNERFHALLERRGVAPYPGVPALLERLRAGGCALACVSSSRNCRPILARAGLDQAFAAVADGTDLAALELAGKPAPDLFLLAARRLGVAPGRAAIVEDAVSGVAAGRAGGFGLVVAIDRGAGTAALRTAGADLVLAETRELAALIG